MDARVTPRRAGERGGVVVAVARGDAATIADASRSREEPARRRRERSARKMSCSFAPASADAAATSATFAPSDMRRDATRNDDARSGVPPTRSKTRARNGSSRLKRAGLMTRIWSPDDRDGFST